MELSYRKAFLFKLWYSFLAVKHLHTVFVIIRKLFEAPLTGIMNNLFNILGFYNIKNKTITNLLLQKS